MIDKASLGKSGIEVFPIGFGANAIGGHNLYPNIDEEENRNLLRAIFESEINFIDTAYVYGNGRSEELIGEVLQEYKREDVVIATKAAHSQNEAGEVIMDNSPDFLRKSVDEALERLQTDYIDLFYIHFPDEATPKDEAVAALAEMKQAGKIRAIGVSNFSLEQLQIANKNGDVDVYQGEFNLVERGAEADLLAYTAEHNITFIPYFPLASGLLTGKYTEEVTFPEDDLRSGQANFKGERYQTIVSKVQQLKPIADKYEVDIVHIVLNWYFSRPSMDVIIPGAKHVDQMRSNLKAVSFELSEDDIQAIDELFADFK